MTDLRDQLADFDAAARRQLTDLIDEFVYPHPLADKIAQRILAAGWTPPGRPACHPRSEMFARGLCERCYEYHRRNNSLATHPRRHRRTADFAADYALLRSEGHTRRQIAERLGMRRNTVDAAYARAVRQGLLTPDPPAVVGHVRTSAFNPRQLDDQINRRTV